MFHVRIRPRLRITAAFGLAGLVFALAVPSYATLARQSMLQTTTVATAQGPLRGLTTPTGQAFLGIPYAAAPVDALRWQPTAPPVSWSGVLDATAQRSACPQLSSGNGPTVANEDCLFLNVYRPLNLPASAKLPVLFWIHGGGFINGSGNQFDGRAFATANNVVVVTINYRLNIFGFLALPKLEAASPEVGDLGLLDQQAALRWTQRNIAAFGGDPHAVTIAGESAGGWSVCDQLASPSAAGLFRAAIVESGTCGTDTQTQAEAWAAAFPKAVGCTNAASLLACFRGKSTTQLLTASANLPGTPKPYPGVAVLPEQPYVAIGAGSWNRVPVLLGNNHDEARAFTGFPYPLSVQGYQQELAAIFGKLEPQVLALYPARGYSQPIYALFAALTDASQGIGPCVANADAGIFQHAGVATFEYQFDDRNAPQAGGVPYVMGAYHSSELQFLWPGYYGNYDRPFDVNEQQLSQDMIHYWGAFVRTGDPNGANRTIWPQFAGAGGAVLSLRPGGNAVIRTFVADHHCGFWTTVEPMPSPNGFGF
jgi:carboxylesterase type B